MVFARNEAPGRMKTRLVPPLTPEQAAAVSFAMAEALLERLSVWSRSSGASGGGAPVELELRYSGSRPAREAEGRASAAGSALIVFRGWTAAPQGAGDLGARLSRAAEAAAAAGVERLVVVGADAPLLPLPLVEVAFAALPAHDAAIAPAEDGGFVLLGLAPGRLPPSAASSLFRAVPWGTAGVFAAILRNAAAAGLGLLRLPGSWDVDRPEDLTRLRGELAALPPSSRLRRLAAVLARILPDG